MMTNSHGERVLSPGDRRRDLVLAGRKARVSFLAMAAAALACGLVGAVPAQAADPLSGRFQIRNVSQHSVELGRCVGWGNKQGHLWPIENRSCSETKRTTWTYNAGTQQLISDGDCAEAWEYVSGAYLPILVKCEAGKSAQRWTVEPGQDSTGGYSINPVIRPEYSLVWTSRHGDGLSIGPQRSDSYGRFNLSAV